MLKLGGNLQIDDFFSHFIIGKDLKIIKKKCPVIRSGLKP